MTHHVDTGVEAAPDTSAPSETDVAMLGRYLTHADMSAFATLVDRHQTDLLRVAHAITGDAGLAEDAVQEGFLRLCREGRALLACAGERSGLGGWLCAVVRNHCIDVLRRRRTTPLPAQAEQRSSTAPIDGHCLWAAVASLPPLERAAVVLRYRDHLDYRTVAERLGKSVSHVGVILHQAMNRLRVHPDLRAEVAP